MKDAKGHGSDANGLHSSLLNNLPSKMTKAHFEVIAKMLRDAAPGANATPVEHAAHAALVSSAADRLATTNPGFNRQRFTDAVTTGTVKMGSRQSSKDNAQAQLARRRTPAQSENAPFKSRLGKSAGHSYLDPRDPRGRK